ncbi:LysR substrate-binding domain-containing protein [Corallococcus sp. Z5C101001]|uniref:LysR substrate-binding domain-containing protein n=1 Tax=Corallococcus sp. Z5C101001 TaxID=2596829 RepID=UPI00117F9A41|nr:LysR substrate-binding domain-containing protein [Corallococcus sp. Z5C101001]TSC34340.1 LysR family transcriptional regulator [Corallococcus sp. Z5C101001]
MPSYALPPLNALRAFEAAARHSSFKAAAAELYVTPTAISHQVRQLEAYLGVRVLDRTPRSVSLTPAGAELYEAVAAGFTDISRVVSRLRQGPTPVTLTLSATPGFLSQWLVPRLDGVRRLLPDIELRLHAGDAPVVLKAGEVDVAIRYGKGPFLGAAATALKRDAFAPVCSPSLKLSRASDLRRAKLIHIDGQRVPRPPTTWARWCAEAGVTGVNTEAGVRFTDSLHAVQSALAGQGVAIVSLLLVADALAAGLLVQPFAKVLRGETYHFVCAPSLSTRADVVALREWFQRNLITPPQEAELSQDATSAGPPRR